MRAVGELAFLEFELAVSSLQWSVALLLIFATALVMTFTLLLVSTILLLLPQGIAAATVILLCALVSAAGVILTFLAVRFVSKKMRFIHLRKQPLETNRESTQ